MTHSAGRLGGKAGYLANRFQIIRHLADDKYTAHVNINNDTLHLMGWMDVAAEPVIVSVPDHDDGRYWVLHTLPFHDIRALENIHELEEGSDGAGGEGRVLLHAAAGCAALRLEPLLADRHWSFVMVPDEKQGFEFVTEEAVQIDRRAAAWFFFTFYPRVMMARRVGTVYLAPTADRTGQPLEPGRNYRLRVPRYVPARQFWSLTLYDNATWAFILNPKVRNGLGSLDRDSMKVNGDGSVDLCFDPDAPAGFESNWLPTMGKKPYLWFRLYAPAEAFWDKSFVLPDVERVG